MQKLSTLADDLWPYLVGRVARVNRNGGGGRVNTGTGGSSGSETLAGLTDVDLGALSDGQLLAYEGSTNKWQNVDPAAGGGLTYTAGNGIAISGGNVISTKHQSAGGIRADANGLYMVLNSESGLGLDSNGLRVGAGNGIDVQGDLTAVHLGTTSGLTFDPASGGGLVVAATLAGAGLGWDNTNKIMSVNVTEGIEYTGDNIRVDEDYPFIWESSHRFNATPQLNANLNIIGADRTITSASGIDLTIDLGVAAGGGKDADLILTAPMTFRSTDYLDDIPIAGFSLFPNTGGDRQLTINTIKSDSLHTRLFVADGVRIDIGEERWGKSMGIVHDDFFVPTLVGNTVSVYFEDSPMLTGALFSINDWVVFKYLNQGVNFAYGLVWGQVTAYTNMGLDADGRGYQRWTFTLRHGDAGVLIKKGNVAVDYGASGQGYAFLSVLSDAVGPWFRIGTWSGANPYTAGNTQIRTQMGNLAGISDADLNPSGYGLYSDNAYLHGMLRTAETIMDDEGLALERQFLDGSLITDPSEFSRIAWWDSLSDRTGEAPIEILGYKANGGLEIGVFNRLYITARTDEVDAATLYLDAGSAAVHLDSRGTIQVGGLVRVQGNVIPEMDISYDLGTTALRWRNLYVDHLYVTGAISGDTLSGAEWEYPGSMIIDAHGTGNLTVTVINQGTGRADLSVDRDIIVGGVVDGVDISAHDANPSAHHNLASAGSGITVAAGQIISVDATVVRTPATVLRTTQLLLTDTPLTGGGQLGDGLTIRLLLAAVDPGLTSATGGLGVLLAATTPGLSLTGGLAVDSSVARTTTSVIAGLGLVGGGTLAASRTFDVGAGVGILVGADDVAVDFTAVPHITTQMIGGAGLVGGGDLSANRTFDVVAGNDSLTVNADDVRVNQGFTFGWTAAHTWSATAPVTFNGIPTFNSAPQVNANLAFIGADRTITASANLTVQPASNLTLDPTGGIVYLPDDVEERSSTFADLVTGINGFRLWTTGGTARQLIIGSIKADSFVTRTFVADTIRLEQGDSYWGKGYGIVNTDFVLPAVNADVNVWFDNVPNTAGNIFTVGDKLLARFVVWTAGVSVKLIWFNVQAFVSADDPNFRQRWTLRRLSGGATGDTVTKGVACEDAGATGQGWIHVTSLSGGPYMEFGTQTSVSSGVPQFTQNVRIGQLSGTVDYSSTAWGFVTGNNLGIGPTAGFSGITIDNTVQGLRVFNAAYQLYNGANLILSLDKTNGLSIEYGSGAFNSIGWYDDLGTGTPAGLRGSLGLQKTGSIYSEMDILSAGLASDAYTRGVVKLTAVNSSGPRYNVWIDDVAVRFGSGSGTASQTGGFITDAIQYLPGNVGIGIAAPDFLLDVQGTVDGDVRARIGNRYYNVASADDTASLEFSFWAGSAAALRQGALISAFKTAAWDSTGNRNAGLGFSVSNAGTSTQAMTIMPSGAVGIGTTGPGYPLDIQGNVDGDVRMRIANTYYNVASTDDTASLEFGFWANNAAALRQGALVQAFKTGDWNTSGGRNAGLGFTVSNAGTLTQALTILPSGFVGIGAGVTAPRSALDLAAGALSFDSNGTTSANIIMGNFGATATWLFRSRADAIILQAGSSDANARTLHMRAGDTIYGLFMNTNGRVSIGSSTAASTTLHVFGAATITGSGYIGPGVAAIRGLLYADFTTRGNTTTGETNLGSYTVTANTLAVDGSSISFWAWGLLAANANAKTVKVYFGADVMTAINTGATSVGFSIRGTIIRKTATTQSIIVEVTYGVNFSQTILANWTRTLSVDNLFKLTAQATATNDIQQYGFKLGWDNAN